MILNISEDAWFGDSLAPHQRLQMARMRAIEFQRPVIRVSNSGLSTVIDERGEVGAISPQFQPALFNATVFPMQGETPYTIYGQWPLWLWMVICLGFALYCNNERPLHNPDDE
jgi:apolipoprotein N-acyltransferase